MMNRHRHGTVSMTARNTDQLREQIDRGKTGDKVDFPDPAAAPLGTDDEASGRRPIVDAIEPGPEQQTVAIEAGTRKRSAGGRVLALVVVVAAIAAIALLAGALV
jgi:hypothetical protein